MEKMYLTKIRHDFMIPILGRVGLDGIYLNKIKSIYGNTTSILFLAAQKLKEIPLKQKIRGKWRKLKGTRYKIRSQITYICRWYNIVCKRYQKFQQLLKTTENFSKVARKINQVIKIYSLSRH